MQVYILTCVLDGPKILVDIHKGWGVFIMQMTSVSVEMTMKKKQSIGH